MARRCAGVVLGIALACIWCMPVVGAPTFSRINTGVGTVASTTLTRLTSLDHGVMYPLSGVQFFARVPYRTTGTIAPWVITTAVNVSAAGVVSVGASSMLQASTSAITEAIVGIVNDAAAMYVCSATTVYRRIGATRTSIAVRWQGGATVYPRGCGQDTVTGAAVLVFTETTNVYVCRYGSSLLPSGTPWDISTPYCQLRSGWTDIAPVAPPTYMGTVSRNAKFFAMPEPNRITLFDIDRCLVNANATGPCWAWTTNTVVPPLAGTVGAGSTFVHMGGVLSGSSDYANSLVQFGTFDVNTKAMTYVRSVLFPYQPRMVFIDWPARIVYAVRVGGYLTRWPLADVGSIDGESQSVTTIAATSVCSIHAPVPNVVLVHCIAGDNYTFTTFRTNDCTGASTIADCFTDPYYCTWYLYGQTCITRLTAETDCTGATAERCIDAYQNITTITPAAGWWEGGTAVNVTVPVLWTSATIKCVFGATEVDGTYNSAARVVSCVSPARTWSTTLVETVTVNIKYLGVTIAPTSYAEFTYYKECGAVGDCAAVLSGLNTTCVVASCDDGLCVATAAALGTVCAVNNVAGTCDGQGRCRQPPDCTVVGDCDAWLVGLNTTCVVASCASGQCKATAAAVGTACAVRNMVGTCDGQGRCRECTADADCTMRYEGSAECVVPKCIDNACMVTIVTPGTQCFDGVFLGECSSAGDCAVAAFCTTDADCSYMDRTQCIFPVCWNDNCIQVFNPGQPCTVGTRNGTCSGDGDCVPSPECTIAGDCSSWLNGIDDTCVVAGCVDGECVAQPAAAETVCTVREPDDGLCDGAGRCIIPPECADGGDCGDYYQMDSECAEMTCQLSKCVVTPLSEGHACTIDLSAGECDGSGNCIVACPTECTADANCSSWLVGLNTTCVVAGCVTGHCKATAAAPGTVCIAQNMVGTCDGQGRCLPPLECTIADDCAGWLPELSTTCIVADCAGGSCVVQPAAEATVCTVREPDDGLCDDAGRCVIPPECTIDDDCGDYYQIDSYCAEMTCQLGKCATTPMDEGHACTIGASAGECDDVGNCVIACPIECTVDANCTAWLVGINTTCVLAACTLGQCIAVPAPPATECIVDGTAGVCDGKGTCISTAGCPVECTVDDDCITWLVGLNTTCVQAECHSSQCKTYPSSSATACFSRGVASMCDGGGNCLAPLECTTDANCTSWLVDINASCIVAKCSSGQCKPSPVALDTACVVGGRTGKCDGVGRCVRDPDCVDDGDCAVLYPLNSTCTIARCIVGTCGAEIVDDGVSCTVPDRGIPGTCDGRGNCLLYECSTDTDCTDRYGTPDTCVLTVCDAGFRCIVDNVEAGVACVVGGAAGVCNADGACLFAECATDAECTPRYNGTNTCIVAQCDGGHCVIATAVAGTVCAGVGSCDGRGGCTAPACPDGCVSDANCTSWLVGLDNDCMVAECVFGQCRAVPLDASTPCELPDHTDSMCDGAGTCVPPPECTIDADCAARYAGNNTCVRPHCTVAHVCDVALTGVGTACAIDDAHTGQCDGEGRCVAIPPCVSDEDCTAVSDNVCITIACVDDACVAGVATNDTACVTAYGASGTCDGSGSCVAPCPPGENCTSTAACTSAANCTGLLGGADNGCLGVRCTVQWTCEVYPRSLGTACTVVGIAGSCDADGNCVQPYCSDDADCGPASSLGACRRWRCSSNGTCLPELLPAGSACTYATADACSVDHLAAAVTGTGACTANGTCVADVDAVPSLVCGGGLSCVAAECTNMYAGCATDADCNGGDTEIVASGCTTTACSATSHTCETRELANGARCVPTLAETEAQPCSADQTGTCVSGVCTLNVSTPSPATCAPDVHCYGAWCYANGTCVVLGTVEELDCDIDPPACVDPGGGECNGRGQCAWSSSYAFCPNASCAIGVCNATTNVCDLVSLAPSCPRSLAGVRAIVAGVTAVALLSVVLQVGVVMLVDNHRMKAA